MSTDDVRVVMERAADRLEGSWAQGGQTSFAPPDLRNRTSQRWEKPLCLMDSLARETAVLVADQTAGQSEAAFEAALETMGREIVRQAVPALLGAMREDIEQNWENYRFSARDAEYLRTDDGKERALGHLSRGVPVHAVWTYNDTYCQGGEHAASLVRKAIKEL